MSKPKDAPTRKINPFGLRMPPELHEQVAAAAEASGRSMNAEIVARLEAPGMTLRDWFAGQALPVALARMKPFSSTGNPGSPHWIRDHKAWCGDLADIASDIADAMLAERSK